MPELISRIELFHVSIPLKHSFYPSWIPKYPQTACNFTLLRLTTEGGLVGQSAGVAMERERQGLGSLLGPYLLGADALDIDAVNQRLREASYLGWRNSFIEAAFWDIRAQAEGLPLYRLLRREMGVADEAVAEVPVYFSMGDLSRGAALREYLDGAKERGVGAVKIRVHAQDEAEDHAAVREARRLAGDDLQLMVDANQGWRVDLFGGAPLWDLERAARFGAVCDECRYTWIEEPLEMYDYDGQAELRRRVKTAIAGGELNAGWHEFKVMLEKGSYDIYQPDVTLAGGIAQAMQVMRACLADGEVAFSPHTWTNGIGLLINLHVKAAWTGRHLPLEYPFQPPGWIPEARDGVMAEPMSLTPRGTLPVPQEPGLGLRVDPGRLRRYGRRFYNLTKTRLILHTIREKGLKTALELKKIKEG